jgi:hypothetical protein
VIDTIRLILVSAVVTEIIRQARNPKAAKCADHTLVAEIENHGHLSVTFNPAARRIGENPKPKFSYSLSDGGSLPICINRGRTHLECHIMAVMMH